MVTTIENETLEFNTSKTCFGAKLFEIQTHSGEAANLAT
jgi:glycine/serine hydroxymethyltransferase